MKTTVTMREYDDEGRMVKETITETEDTYVYRQPIYQQVPTWNPSPNYPVPTIWCSTNTTNALSNPGAYMSGASA